MSQVKLHDVATAGGVSVQTASRVTNQRSRILGIITLLLNDYFRAQIIMGLEK